MPGNNLGNIPQNSLNNYGSSKATPLQKPPAELSPLQSRLAYSSRLIYNRPGPQRSRTIVAPRFGDQRAPKGLPTFWSSLFGQPT